MSLWWRWFNIVVIAVLLSVIIVIVGYTDYHSRTWLDVGKTINILYSSIAIITVNALWRSGTW